MQLKLKNEVVEQEVKAALAVEPAESAEIVGLVYVSDKTPGIKRQRKGKGFCYYDTEGNKICCEDELNRIKALVIPPAWNEVWICNEVNGHLQATGRDEKGRKQYRYHQHWRKIRSQTKFNRTDVNDYLKEITSLDFTAKDFRTWFGTVLAAEELYELGEFESEKQAKKNIVQAIKNVAEELGNRPATCRKYYVHPGILAAYQESRLFSAIEKANQTETSQSKLFPIEQAVLNILEQHLLQQVEQ